MNCSASRKIRHRTQCLYDNHIIARITEGQPDFIVSGDHNLLAISEHKVIPCLFLICPAFDFYDFFHHAILKSINHDEKNHALFHHQSNVKSRDLQSFLMIDGGGKTTLSIHAAVAAAEAGEKVVFGCEPLGSTEL